MSGYPLNCARRDFRTMRLAMASYAFAAALSNLLLVFATLTCGAVLLIHLGSKWLGGPTYIALSVTAFHFFVYSCLALCMLIATSITLTIGHSLIRKEVEEDIRLRELLYAEVMAITA